MNKKSLGFSVVGLITFLVLIVLVLSCTPKDYIISGSDSFKTILTELHQNHTSRTNSELNINEEIDLYIDFSTCVAQAEEEDASENPIYHAIRTKLFYMDPALWYIRGNIISQEEEGLYPFLGRVNEVSYADLRTTVNRIVQGNNQAILITDGEYYQSNASMDNLSNPYLARAFADWLRKGNDIYIISESYQEDATYDKYRYHMVFTNHNIPNNAYNQIETVLDNDAQNKVVHLSISDFKIETRYPGLTKPLANQVLALNELTYFAEPTFEVQEYTINWSDIEKYIQNGLDPNTGNPIPGGDTILRGIFLDDQEIKYHDIKELDLVVYNIYDAFRTMEDTSYFYKTSDFRKIEEIFTIDNEAFRETGEIVLKVHNNFVGKGLNSKSDPVHKENLLRVDIVIQEVDHSFDNHSYDFEIFRWESISPQYSGMTNVSVYNSIKSVIEDQTLTPKSINDGILYTIYIRTICSDI